MIASGGTGKRPAIAFCYFRPPDEMPSYVTRDVAILEEIADVEWVRSQPFPRWRRRLGPTGWLPDRRVRAAVKRADLVFQWFATPPACVVAARLSRKPAIVVSGGFDVAYEPSIDYGRRIHPLTRWMSRLTLTAATQVLAVSRFNAGEASACAPRARISVLPHGFEPAPAPAADRVARVVTVGAISWEYMERKGLADFARASRALPEIDFVLAGAHVTDDAVAHLRALGGENLKLPGYLAQQELAELLGTSAVYLQLSRHEAFGCSVAEAMLAGCTPVLSRAAALPEVAGGAARYVDSRDPDVVAGAVRAALADPRPAAAHERIAENYPRSARQEELRAVVARCLAE